MKIFAREIFSRAGVVAAASIAFLATLEQVFYNGGHPLYAFCIAAAVVWLLWNGKDQIRSAYEEKNDA